MMKYPKEYLDEIKNRLKVSTVIGKSVNLKKRGKEFIGLSPFKNEKTPSFTVNDDKGFYHCFSSGEHGNIFDFVMKTQNLKFGEVVRLLASEAGLPSYKFSKLDEKKEKQWKIYSKILEEYKMFYNKEILNTSSEEVKQYIVKRGITKKEIENFKIGYVPKNPSFFEYLSKKYSDEEIQTSGLFYLDERNKRYVERFRDRLIFPINNLNGSIIGFGGRIISKKNIFSKYINSPETLFFKKGNNLFNLDKAKKYSNQYNEIYLVEGYMDVLTLNKFAIINTVANLGTALTDIQTKLIWRFFNHIIITFDGDEAGMEAAIRAAERLISIIKPDLKISFLFLDKGHDPDSFVNEYGKEKFISFSKNKILIHKFIWDHYSSNIDYKDPSSLAKLEKTLTIKANTIEDEIVKKYMLEFFYEMLSQFTPITSNKKKVGQHSSYRPLNQTKKIIFKKKNYKEIELKEFSILYLIIHNLEIFEEKIELITELKLFSPECKGFLEEIIKYLSNQNIHNTPDSKLYFDKSNFKDLINKINNLVALKYILKSKKNESEILTIYDEMVKELKNLGINNKIELLESKLIENMNEKTYQELINLKKQVISG